MPMLQMDPSLSCCTGHVASPQRTAIHVAATLHAGKGFLSRDFWQQGAKGSSW